MSYEGGKLAPWFETAPNRLALRRMADRGGEALVGEVKRRTPVDEGVLRASVRQKPVRRTRDARARVAYESGAETEVEYGPHVEYGTGLWGPRRARYIIRPRRPGGWLHWVDPDTGRDVFAKEVRHPGSPGAHMFAIGCAVIEGRLETILQPELLRWARSVEAQNRTSFRRALP
jgi:hypothetical protein